MRILAFLALLAISCAAVAQETYSIPASAPNVTTLTQVITAQNGDLCARYGLARTCSQAQLCTAAGNPFGSGCTAAQARAASQRIYPNTTAGREEFTQFAVTLPKFNELVTTQQGEQRRSFCEFWLAANTTARNNACAAIGASAGCEPACQ